MLDLPEMVERETIIKFKRKLSESVNRADGIIAVSNFTKNGLIENFGQAIADKIRVIYHGSDFDSFSSQQPNFSLPSDYILFVSTIEPRKNLSALIRAFSYIRSQKRKLHLLIVGRKGWDYLNIKKLIAEESLEKSVIFLDYLNRQELKYLYEKAKSLVFPSHYEGFGLPILEAAYTGTPVLCSSIPVFKEIYKDFPVYFERNNPEDIAQKTLELINSPDRCRARIKLSREIKHKYRWPNTTEETLKFYRDRMQ
jgi:glycosyltransferase involved in cell wall biosynthesis